jgi:hypothetical protein
MTEYEIMSANISGLTPGTTYYFCAMVRSHNLMVYGTVLSFTTPLTNPDPGGPGGPGSPGNPGSGINMIPATAIGDVHTVNPATDITDIEATFHGSVSGIEGGTAYGYFRYSAQKTPPIFCNDIFGSNMRSVPAGATGGNYASGVVSNGNFNAKVVDLMPNTVYHYCAVVSNGAKSNTIIKYGEVRSIRTYPCQTCDQTQIKTLPTVVINGTSANLHGEYGSTKALTTYFEYKSTEIAGDWKKTPELEHVQNSYGRMTNLITGLRPSTNYVARAVGITADPVETFFGGNVYFKTHTADGFGDGEGWIFDGYTPWENPPGPGPGLECAEAGLDNPIQGCEDYTGSCPSGWSGTYPLCINPNGGQCPPGWSGTYPACVNPDGTDSCPPYWSGVFPECIDPNDNTQCPPGWSGTYPACAIPDNNDDYDDGIGGGDYGGYTPNDYSGVGGGNIDFDNDGIGNGNDNDMDGDGNTNGNDSDTDGDGLGNGVDTDDDNDGIFDYNDSTPLGFGSNSNDLDGDGLSNSVDTDDDGDGIPDINDPTPFGTGSNINDLDGDGINNSLDTDVDGDGIPNNTDPDDDNDGLPDHLDDSPLGNGFVAGSGDNQGGGQGNGEPQIGDDANPPSDAIVRHHEGVETVFIRQIMRNTPLAKKYGYRDGEDMQKFSWYLAHFLGKSYGYVAKNKKEVRVRYEDVAAYELKEVGNTTTVYESFDNTGKGDFKITGVRKLNSLFKMIFKYEYYFLKRR